MDNINIIISRFNESLEWTLEYPFNQFKYIVYNKGDNDLFEKSRINTIIPLKNVGRNDHTYLYHIVSNYKTLAAITVFFPGSLDLKYKKERASQLLIKILESNLKYAYFIGHYQDNVKNSFADFYLDNWKATSCENSLKNPEDVLQKCRIRPYKNWYTYFFGNTIAHWSTWWGIFSIDKRDIIQHPINRYIALLNTVNKHSNPEAGHYIERSWGVIFYPMIYTKKIK